MIECWLCLQIPHLRPAEYKRSRLPRNRRTVNRAYGGVLSGGAVRERYVSKVSVQCSFISFHMESFKINFAGHVFIFSIGFVGSSEPS